MYSPSLKWHALSWGERRWWGRESSGSEADVWVIWWHRGESVSCWWGERRSEKQHSCPVKKEIIKGGDMDFQGITFLYENDLWDVHLIKIAVNLLHLAVTAKKRKRWHDISCTGGAFDDGTGSIHLTCKCTSNKLDCLLDGAVSFEGLIVLL